MIAPGTGVVKAGGGHRDIGQATETILSASAVDLTEPAGLALNPLFRGPFSQLFHVAKVFGAAGLLLVAEQCRTAECIAIPSNSASLRVAHASSKLSPEMAVNRSIRFGFTPNWTTISGEQRSAAWIPRLPKPNSDSARKTRFAFSPVGRTSRSRSAV